MKKEWKLINPNITYSDGDDIVDEILTIRGIKDKKSFLNPTEDLIHSPFELKNMKDACNKIIKAIDDNKSMAVYYDNDADGLTSGTQMIKFLRSSNIDPKIYANQRKEGHGIIIDKVIDDIDLLIIVDSSTNSVEECKALKDKGIDIIILDHHEQEKENPYALIVNPQCCDYENKDLSGAGVVWQCIRGIDELQLSEYADEYTDICSVGLIGDVMNVAQLETRAIINKGLKKMHSNPDHNLELVLKHLKKTWNPNATDVGFYICPFFNAIIRLGDIFDAINILICDDDKEVKKLIKKCGSKNNDRKELQAELVDKIDGMIDNTHKVIIVDTSDFESMNSGLNGLLATNISDKYQKPTFVCRYDKDTNCLMGSARSYNKIPLKDLCDNSGLFELAQGHQGAFGIEFSIDNKNKVYDYFDNELAQQKEINYDVDMELQPEDITWDLLKKIQDLSYICGQGFKTPTFVIDGLPIENVKSMKDIHMKLVIDNEIEAVQFNVGEDYIEGMKNKDFIDVMGTLSINSFYNFGLKQTIKTKQIMIEDCEAY